MFTFDGWARRIKSTWLDYEAREEPGWGDGHLQRAKEPR
jgi:hypothetical protein